MNDREKSWSTIQKYFFLKTYDFYLTPREKLILPPFKGSALRTGLGDALRTIFCRNRQHDCRTCSFRGSKCGYSVVLGSPHSEKVSLLEKTPFTPLPFVLEPPLEDKTAYRPGEKISFSLILIGKANFFLPSFVEAFDSLGNRGIGTEHRKYQLLEVKTRSRPSASLYQPDAGPSPPRPLENDLWNLSPDFREKEEIRLCFLTPLHLKSDDSPAQSPRFSTLFSSLLRNITILSLLYCDQKLFFPHRKLIAQAKTVRPRRSHLNWYDWEHPVNRPDPHPSFGGFLGEITYRGDHLEAFLPFLWLGTFLHLGKGASFGLGKYVLREPPGR